MVFSEPLKVWKPLWARGQTPHSGPRSSLSVPRLTGLEESAWGDDEDTDHNYYNSVPGKEPPLGGLVDSRLALTQPCALGGLGQVSLCGLGREGLRQGQPPADSMGPVPGSSSPALLNAGGGSFPALRPQTAGV